ncbi:MAG: hypothetical protein KatS3mg110_0213 [Pirellulaceae bacterium]|nr:MAG: hypothetical protein KatS3mg110_0213 [Pirellulaceae bacterium]
MMIRREFAPARQLYRVRLGHLVVMVEAPNREEAIRRARRQLGREWPRLWDMIQQAAEQRFQVEKL